LRRNEGIQKHLQAKETTKKTHSILRYRRKLTQQYHRHLLLERKLEKMERKAFSRRK
jgi:hypothetical protein